MRHYSARVRLSDGRYDYAVDQRDGGARAVGYCCKYEPLEDIPNLSYKFSDKEKAEHASTAHKHHTDGHATADEACECYKEYILDHRLRTFVQRDAKNKCKACGEWTQDMVETDHRVFSLCHTHDIRAEVSKLISVGESWCS